MTIGIDPDIEKEWIEWIKRNHIPAVLKTGLFQNAKMYKVLHDADDGTLSYSIQYFAKNINDVTNYLNNFAPAILDEHRRKFMNKHVAFQTLLEEL
jgi:hypothetical protein